MRRLLTAFCLAAMALPAVAQTSAAGAAKPGEVQEIVVTEVADDRRIRLLQRFVSQSFTVARPLGRVEEPDA